LKLLQELDLLDEKESATAKWALLSGLLTLKKFIATLFSRQESVTGSISFIKALPFLVVMPFELQMPRPDKLVGVRLVSFSKKDEASR